MASFIPYIEQFTDSSFINNKTQMPLFPALFVGHGSPMNAIEENEFVQTWQKQSAELPLPKAILCISAHWETKGTFLTGMKHPKTIHDFGGFPQKLFDVEYPVLGNPELAKEIKDTLHNHYLDLDLSHWGLDHGSWSVLKRMYPEANIPVIQMSINQNYSAIQHYDLAKELAFLRQKGVLIIGSGNIVHNLRVLDWQNSNPNFGFDWAISANSKIKSWIDSNDIQSLANARSFGKEFELAIPTPEHYLPMMYVLALRQKDEEISYFNDTPVMGSISMTSFRIG